MIGDIVGTSYGVVFLVSDRFIETLKTNGFRGWVTFPVVVLNNAQEEITGYHGFAVKGRSGPIDRSRGERVIVPPPSPQGGAVAAVRGVFPDETEWDGSDIFVPAAEREKRPVYVFVLDSVKKAIDAAGLTNVNFQRATEVEEMIV